MEMTAGLYIGLGVLGVVVGIISGMLGLGGGILVVPMLVMLFKFDQKVANGTSLAMIFPPAALPALRVYYRAGNIHVGAALTLAAGFLLGAYVGALLANAPWVHPDALRTFFGFFALFLATLMLFRGQPNVRAAAGTVLVLAGYAAAYVALRVLGRRWERRAGAHEMYCDRLNKPFEPDYHI